MVVVAMLDVGQFSTFDLDDLEGRVILLSRGFRVWGVHFWSYFLDTGSRSKVKLRNFNVLLLFIRHDDGTRHLTHSTMTSIETLSTVLLAISGHNPLLLFIIIIYT